MATLVPAEELLDTVIAATIAGTGVTVAFSVAIWGVARFAEHSRNDRRLAAAGSALVAALGLLAVTAALVTGILVMTHG